MCEGGYKINVRNYFAVGIGDKSKIYISIKKEKVTVTGQVNSAASAVSARKPESDPLMAPLLKVKIINIHDISLIFSCCSFCRIIRNCINKC